MIFSWRTIPTVAIAVAIVAAIVYAFLPQPVTVDLATVNRGPLQVTVDEDGKTRIKERYMVSAPLAGRLLRIELDPGDDIERGSTLLARIEPSDPALLDARALAEAEAKVKASQAALNRARPLLNQAKLELEYAETEFGRLAKLRRTDAVTQQDLENAELDFRAKGEIYRSAKFAEEIARFELEMAQAALRRTRPTNESSNGPGQMFEISSPIDGRVLRVIHESSKVVTAGTDLIEVGDPADLEVEIDVLSRDAVRILPGQRVILEQWGGDQPLIGIVRLVEPSGFTKISALGVEEQRVNVIVDFADAPESRATLGDNFRVEARIVVWEHDDVLKVPTSALFRHQDVWAVFTVDGEQRARLTPITIHHRSGLEAEVTAGLEENDTVVIHPSDRIAEGVTVVSRKSFEAS